MKTANIWLGLLLILMVSQAHSKEERHECGTLLSRGQIERELAFLSGGRTYEDLPLIQRGAANELIPIVVHIVRASDGTGGVSTGQVDTSIQQLNAQFTSVDWTFVRIGSFDYIDSDYFFRIPEVQSRRDSLRQINPFPFVINVYYTNLESINGQATFSADPVQGILIDNGAVTNGSTLAHEMGHYFDLHHTHETAFGVECPNSVNCLIAGDLLCDTPADPNLSGRVDNCVFTHVIDPPFGCGPQAYAPDVDLLMSYAPTECRNRFSAQQIAKMQFVRITFRAYIQLPLYTWIGSDGSWSDPSNWPLGLVPQADNTVTILLYGTYRMYAASSVSIAAIDFRASQGKQTLAIVGGTFTLGSGGIVNSQGILDLEGGTLNVPAGATLTIEGSYNQTGGSLTGSGTVVIKGSGSWNEGEMTGNGSAVGITRVDTGATLSIRRGSVKRLTYRTLDIHGTASWSDTSNLELSNSTIRTRIGGIFFCSTDRSLLSVNGSGTIQNDGSFVKLDDLGNRSMIVGQGPGFQIINSGTVRSEGGTLRLYGQCISSGAFETPSGWIVMHSASLALNDGTRFIGTAPNSYYGTTIRSTATLDGTARVEPGARLQLDPGSILTGSGAMTIAGELLWTGGRIDGTSGSVVTVQPGGFIIAGDSSECQLRNRRIDVNGTFEWRGAGDIIMYESGRIAVREQGVLQIRNSRTMAGNPGYGMGYLDNFGTIRKSASTGTTALGPTISNMVITSRGRLEVDSGQVDIYSGSSRNATYSTGKKGTIAFMADHTFDTASFVGSGVSKIGASNRYYTLRGLIQADSLELIGGNYRDSCTIRGQAVWTGGIMGGGMRMTVDSGSTFRFKGNQELNNHGSAIVNLGRLSWEDSSSIAHAFGGRITNTPSGVFEIWNDGALYAISGFGGGSLQNQGTIVKRGGTGVSYLGVGGSGLLVVTNTGNITSQVGTIRMSNSSGPSTGAWMTTPGAFIEFDENHTFQKGTMFGGGGVTRLLFSGLRQNIFTFSDTIISYNLDLAGGTINGNWWLMGTARWTGSFFNGWYAFSIDSAATLIIDGSLAKRMNSTRINNYGVVRWIGSSDISVAFDGSIWNHAPGLFEIRSDSGTLHQHLAVPGYGSSSFVNLGTLRKIGGPGSTTAFGGFGSNNVSFTNSGVVEAIQGVLYFGGSYSQNAGGRMVLNGGTITGASNLTMNSGELAGAGVIGTGLTNGGTVRPGDGGVGRIEIQGNYTQLAAGQLDVQIAGSDTTAIDRLHIAGSATLGGTLNISLIDPYAPDSGNTFRPLTYVYRSGSFAVINGLTPGNGLQFAQSYAPAYFELRTSGALQLPGFAAALFPVDSADVKPDSLMFVWRKAVPAVTRYRLEIATDAAFITPVLDSLVRDTIFSGVQFQPNTTYWWRVIAGNSAGWGVAGSGRMFRTLLTGVDEGDEEEIRISNLPTEFILHQNYPNPFNPTTILNFGLPVASYVTLRVYNPLGQEIATLVDEEMQPGTHTAAWNAAGMASGMYFCRLQAGGLTATRKLILMR